GLLVLDEVVERVALVGHLHLAVLALGRAQQRGLGGAGGLRLAAREQRRPGRRARVVTRALGRLVLLEQVQRAAVGADEESAELAVPCVDGGGPRGKTRAAEGEATDDGGDNDGEAHGRSLVVESPPPKGYERGPTSVQGRP